MPDSHVLAQTLIFLITISFFFFFFFYCGPQPTTVDHHRQQHCVNTTVNTAPTTLSSSEVCVGVRMQRPCAWTSSQRSLTAKLLRRLISPDRRNTPQNDQRIVGDPPPQPPRQSVRGPCHGSPEGAGGGGSRKGARKTPPPLAQAKISPTPVRGSAFLIVGAIVFEKYSFAPLAAQAVSHH